MWAVSLTHSLCGQFLLHIPKFMRTVSFTISLCGQFLLHILYVGSLSYTFQGYMNSRFSYTFFMWAVSLTHSSMWPISLTHSKVVYVRSFSYTLFFMWPVSLTHSKVYEGSFFYTFSMWPVSLTHSLCEHFLLHILYVRIFFYKSHASYFVSWGFSLPHLALASLCGEFPLKEVFT